MSKKLITITFFLDEYEMTKDGVKTTEVDLEEFKETLSDSVEDFICNSLDGNTYLDYWTYHITKHRG
jgi:hypothetical protein